jgi:NAD(P)-dependent dehydrogenase (short-subunit alcohol dehydrogenase family)
MGRELDGRTIVITGGSSGIGAAAARMLRAKGAEVVITGRSAETQRLADEIGADPHLVDFADLADVERFAQALLDRYPRIDVLVNNVGGIIGDRRVTRDGHEMTLQVNHLAGFLLTRRLRQRLEESRAVVINTSSVANNLGSIDFDDLQNEKSYQAFRAYGRAKLMNILHAMEIERRFDGVHAASFHPGGISTGFAREGGGLIRWIYESPLRHLFLKSPEKGVDTLVWLVTARPGADWTSGEYYARRKPARRNPQATPANAARLWEASEALLAGSASRS